MTDTGFRSFFLVSAVTVALLGGCDGSNTSLGSKYKDGGGEQAPDANVGAGGGSGAEVGSGGMSGSGGATATGGSTGASCMTSASGIACASSTAFCEMPAGTCNRITGAWGMCTEVPTMCPTVSAPVCGCNGKIYGNDCLRQAARVSRAADGECATGSGGASGTGGRTGAGGATSTGGKSGGGGAGGTGGTGGSTVRRCGGFIGTGCGANEFCEYGPEVCVGSDTMGVCTPIPTVCPAVLAPVCGCVGSQLCDCSRTTYANDCVRQMAGVFKIADGECPPTPDGGIPAALVLSPPGASFNQGIGTTSAPTVFSVQNNGPGDSGKLTVGITGAGASTYVITGNTCVAPVSAGQSCQVSVAFKAPTIAGDYHLATLNITAASAGSLGAPLVGHALSPPDAGIDGGSPVPECLSLPGGVCATMVSGCASCPAGFYPNPTRAGCDGQYQWCCTKAAPAASSCTDAGGVCIAPDGGTCPDKWTGSALACGGGASSTCCMPTPADCPAFPLRCADIGGICTAARWGICPPGMEIHALGTDQLGCENNWDGWCCVDAPPSTCADGAGGKRGMCVPGECSGCFGYIISSGPGLALTCEAGRSCCVDICY